MSTIRFFSGGRDYSRKKSFSAQMLRNQISKGGRISAAERFKAIRDEKLEENRQKASQRSPFALPGAKVHKRKLSKHAERMLKLMAEKKAARKARAERKRVVVQPRTYTNGSIIKNGKIFDIQGNIVAKVETKNGKIILQAGMGGLLGYYKPKSLATNAIIQDAINKYSPYYINLRKMQDMQQGMGVWGTPTDVINIYGRAPVVHNEEHSLLSHGDPGVYGDYGSDQNGPRQNVGSTAWGAMSDNVWGTFSDNVWGTSADTVWGTNTSDVWGGIGGSPWGHGVGGNPWGFYAKTVNIWGSGNGHNYLSALAAKVALFFGLHLPTAASSAHHEALMARASSGHDAHEQFTRASSHDAHDHLQATRAAAQGGHDAHEHAQATRAQSHEAHEHVTFTRAILNLFMRH